MVIPALTSLIGCNGLDGTGDEAQGMAIGMVVISIVFLGITIGMMQGVDVYLERNYDIYGYKTEMKFKL